MSKTLLIILFFNFYLLGAQEDIVNPPGTLSLDDNFYIDKTPVTNMMFLEYLTVKNFLSKKGYSSFRHYIQSTSENGFPLEMTTINYISPILTYLNSTNKYLKRRQYYEDVKFESHPILNISKKQAEDFCKWRTEMVKHLWHNDEKYLPNRIIASKISYRLASRTELLLAKEVFANRKILTEFKSKKLLKIDLPSEKDKFIILPITEFTESEDLFNNNLNIKSHLKFTGFRCVCEIME